MNTETIKSFVENTRRPLSVHNRLSRCVDGRYENIDNMPMVAKPGADAGDVMALMGAFNILHANVPNETAVNVVLESIGGVQNFRLHTAEKADQSIPGIGCGHINEAKKNPESYGLTAEQIEFLIAQLPKLLEQGAVQEVLLGEHKETDVVVVDSEHFGIEPLLRTGDGLQEAFVYQSTLHGVQLRNLARLAHEALLEAGVVVEEQDVMKAVNDSFDRQLGKTLELLADGLPTYTAKIDADGNVEIVE